MGTHARVPCGEESERKRRVSREDMTKLANVFFSPR